ncbi:hypothetical protein [Dongia rigui]|uniref:Uncharacterized protein n=1 Tax=Dongia rigui TaxID=940149 RepID=A0ABU5E486_9PROT|nr:hypothetical protein [Dongia rigui]MDY0874117.1 hypothetical protein [Dongia rigui]
MDQIIAAEFVIGSVACLFTFLAPRSLRRGYFALLLVVVATFAFLIHRSRGNSPGAGLDAMFVIMTEISVICGSILGVIFRWLCTKENSSELIGLQSPSPFQLHHFEIVGAGMIVTYLGGLMMIPLLQGRAALLQCLMLGSATLLIVGSLHGARVSNRYVQWVMLPASCGLFMAMIGLSAIMSFLGGAFYTTRIVESAEQAAGNTPYCIEVANNDGPGSYHAAVSLWDLHPLVMTARYPYSERHAKIVTAQPASSTRAHWSYNAGRFVPSWALSWEVGDSPACTPALGFAADLSWFHWQH